MERNYRSSRKHLQNTQKRVARCLFSNSQVIRQVWKLVLGNIHNLRPLFENDGFLTIFLVFGRTTFMGHFRLTYLTHLSCWVSIMHARVAICSLSYASKVMIYDFTFKQNSLFCNLNKRFIVPNNEPDTHIQSRQSSFRSSRIYLSRIVELYCGPIAF